MTMKNQLYIKADLIKTKIPFCDWIDDPAKWNRANFLEEVSEYLWIKAGIGSNLDKHLLGALGAQMEIFVKCWEHIQRYGLIQEFRNETIGQNPHIAIGDKALARAIVIMNEIGLTKELRNKEVKPGKDLYTDLLKGPKNVNL